MIYSMFALFAMILVCASPLVHATRPRAADAGIALAPVGMAVQKFDDQSRANWQGTGPRPENTLIWYPAATGSKIGPVRYGDPTQAPYFTQYQVAHDAEIAAEPGTHPVLLLSHGSTALALELMWLGYY